MRIAALYDIHGNLPALEAVFDEIMAENVDRVVIGGDVVAGPMARETIAYLKDASQKMHIDFIHGNHESEMLSSVNGEPINSLSSRAEEEAKWAAAQLSEADVQFVAGWPLVLQLDLPHFGTVLFCHATPKDDMTVFTAKSDESRLFSLFVDVSAAIVVCGHTHMQFDLKIGDVRVLNAGSVGFPFGHTGADWLLMGDQIEFRHTNYALDDAAQRIRATHYPESASFADNILQAPSIADAYQMLTQIEASQDA